MGLRPGIKVDPLAAPGLIEPRTTRRMVESERIFYEIHFNKTGHRMIPQPERRAVGLENGFASGRYNVDFYCPECGVYFEVCNTDASYHDHVGDITGWRKLYTEPIYIVRPNGKRFHCQKKHHRKPQWTLSKPMRAKDLKAMRESIMSFGQEIAS